MSSEHWQSNPSPSLTDKMSQDGPPEGNVQGGENVIEEEIPEFVGSDVVTRNTRVISQNLVEILTDTDAR